MNIKKIQTKCYQALINSEGRFLGYRVTLNVPILFYLQTRDYYSLQGKDHYFYHLKNKYYYKKEFSDFDVMKKDIAQIQLDVLNWKETQLFNRKKQLLELI